MSSKRSKGDLLSETLQRRKAVKRRQTDPTESQQIQAEFAGMPRNSALVESLQDLRQSYTDSEEHFRAACIKELIAAVDELEDGIVHAEDVRSLKGGDHDDTVEHVKEFFATYEEEEVDGAEGAGADDGEEDEGAAAEFTARSGGGGGGGGGGGSKKPRSG